MEFAFGTNWATYSRFVGDIFGAPLAAEGLFAFFLESMFLGVLIFGRDKVSKGFYHLSAWLVWAGSLLSAVWILIAVSWMQTPAGYEVVGEGAARKAVLTDFFAAALNPSIVPRYLHTINAILALGGFCAVALAAYYLLKCRFPHFAKKTMATGIAITLVTTLLIPVLGHYQSVNVATYQPEKMAAFEGHFETGPLPLGLIGWVDSDAGTVRGLEIPGAASLLLGQPGKDFIGLNDIPADEHPPLQLTFQSYHFMIALWAVMIVLIALAWWTHRKGTLAENKGLLKLLTFSPIFPMLAIQLGWIAAEVGRQPWIVWKELRTADAVSAAVPALEILISLIMFTVFYTIVYVAWVRIVGRFIAKGPENEEEAIVDAR